MSEKPRRSRVHRGGKNLRLQNGDVDSTTDEFETCLICAEKIDYLALTPCNHSTCHKCTFRQRALYEKPNCLICRSENDTIIITNEFEKEFDQFDPGQFATFNQEYKIGFTQNYIAQDTLNLLKPICVICKNDQLTNFKQLQEHVKEEHGKYFCLICSKFKKVFIEELQLYSYKALLKHQQQGESSIGFKGHPECKYCHGKRFYSEDELNVHIRDRHERCHICDQTNPKRADYYKNYDSLYFHFSKEHFVCTVPSCVEKRFVVFRDELDLTSHMLKEHGSLNREKIIIGSNTHHHHYSQLSSTFQNNRRWLEINDDDDEMKQQQSPEIKRKRFEERAKHYLNYDQGKYNEFVKLNDMYKGKKITSKELLTHYQNLFKTQSNEEINILIKEFSEFFDKKTELQNNLKLIIHDDELSSSSENFPVLGGSSSTNNVFNQSWVSNTSKSVDDNFPALMKPKKSNNNVVNKPIKYTTVKRTVPPSGKKKLNILDMDTTYRPTYLDNKNGLTSLSNNGKSNSSSSLPLSTSYSNTSLNNGNKSIDDNKFPALQKKSTKKVIPRVKEVKIDVDSWGRPQQEAESGKSEDGIEILDKRKQKMKKKQDRLLFTNGHL